MLKKKYIKFTTILLLGLSSPLTLIACKNPTREDMSLTKEQNNQIYLSFLKFLAKNNLTGEALFNKNIDKLRDIAKSLTKELIARNEYSKWRAEVEGKEYDTLTNDEYKTYQQNGFDKNHEDISIEDLYQTYLDAIKSGVYPEPGILKKGYNINQDNDWHIFGTLKPSSRDTWDDTVIPTRDINFKRKLADRFQEYIKFGLKPEKINQMFALSYLRRTKYFALNSINNTKKFDATPGSFIAKAIQGWSTQNIWNSKIKMVWELKVDKKDKKFLDDVKDTDGAGKILPGVKLPKENDENIFKKFNDDRNKIEDRDPIFNMKGFRGFIAYKNENSEETYGKNKLDTLYKSEVFKTNKAEFAKQYPIQGDPIDTYVDANKNNYSKVLVLPIYLIDLVLGKDALKINNIDVTINDNLKSQWQNNEKEIDGKIQKNSERNNTEMQNNMNSDLKTKLLKWIEYTVTQSDGNDELFKEAEADLYVQYIQNRKNIYDKSLYNWFEEWFKDLEKKK